LAAAKNDNILLSPGVFDPSKGETSRSTANVLALSGVWLDNDGGDLDHAQFTKLFPCFGPACINSALTKESDLRYFVFIPTTSRMPDEVHSDILRMN
jgi:hypothetical protein